jgi:hypothetical protein
MNLPSDPESTSRFGPWRAYSKLSHLKKALLIALVFHSVLLLILPPLPIFKLSGFDRSQGLIVTFLKEVEPPLFNASLNQELPMAIDVDEVTTPSFGARNVDVGDDQFVSDQSKRDELNGNESAEQPINGNLASQSDTPSVRFDFAAIRQFAKRDAIRYAEYQPRKVERFARTFNRSRSRYRRNKNESYRNQIGDIYARSNSSAGDVCFKQQRDDSRSDYSTNTVYFFRCDSTPLGFKIKSKNKEKGKG